FGSNLVFGNGFDTMSEVHNGFLRIASENGLALLLPLCIIIAVALRSALAKRDPLSSAILLGYFAYVFTYPRMFNMNVAAALFYLALFKSIPGSLSRTSVEGIPTCRLRVRDEPPRLFRRLHFLRGWSYEEVYEIFARSPRTRGAHGVRA